MTTFVPYTLTIAGRGSIALSRPWVMGIVNATPDSFYAGSRVDMDGGDAVERRVAAMLAEGADIIDVGACSTRPGAELPTADEELRRLRHVLPAVRRALDHTPAPPCADGARPLLSIDTFRANVAEACVEEFGAEMVNDIGGGRLDDEMLRTVGRMGVAYVAMHSRGMPATMASLTDYGGDVVAGVADELTQTLQRAREAGISALLADPGFGFAKTRAQNFELLRRLPDLFAALPAVPMLVGVSRKSMVTATLGCTAADALAGTTALHTAALLAGAHVLRVHDVGAAVQAARIVDELRKPSELR